MQIVTKSITAMIAPISTPEISSSFAAGFEHNSLRDDSDSGIELFETEQQYETQVCQSAERLVSFKGGEKQKANEQETWSKVKKHWFEEKS